MYFWNYEFNEAVTSPLQAAQGSEPELLIPISVVSNTLQGEPSLTSDSNVLLAPQLVLCGDPNQRTLTVSQKDMSHAEPRPHTQLDLLSLQKLLVAPNSMFPFSNDFLNGRYMLNILKRDRQCLLTRQGIKLRISYHLPTWSRCVACDH